MMDEKRLEEEYRELKRQAAPDLWARIEANLKDHPERDTDMGENQGIERQNNDEKEIEEKAEEITEKKIEEKTKEKIEEKTEKKINGEGEKERTNEVKSETTNEVRSEVQKEINNERKGDIEKNIEGDIEEDLEGDIKGDIEEDIGGDVKRDIKKDVKKDIKEEIKKREPEIRDGKTTEGKVMKFRKGRSFYGAAAAAAAVIILVSVYPIMGGGFGGFSSRSQSETTAASFSKDNEEMMEAADVLKDENEAAFEAENMPEDGVAEESIAAKVYPAEADSGNTVPGGSAVSGGSTASGGSAGPGGSMGPGGRAPGSSAVSGYDKRPGNDTVMEHSVTTEESIESGASGSRRSGSMEARDFNTEEYNYIAENGFRRTADEPVSTFSVDVDTAAYSNIRRMLYAGEHVPADAVRIEEMINYFSYDYPEPKKGEPFSVTTEYAPCPWNPDNRLLMIGLQAEKIDFSKHPSSNLVFLLDVSGSMRDENKLPLIQKAFAMLAENLTEDDRVSIVTYSGYESVALDGVPGNRTSEIIDILDGLEASGSTAGAAGIQKAYELAQKHYIEGGSNRVILATDGDLNVGISSEGDLIRLIEEKKKSGVHLSVLGVGTGNLKDNKLEALADHGDGNYNYIDSIYEAKKVLVDEMGGTLMTVAKDVKLQLEFNPEQAAQYRLIGYENRIMEREDFDNDKADAGEIGAGHTVTALYEIVPSSDENRQGSSGLKYQRAAKTTGSSELLTVSLRYKEPDSDTSKLLQYPVESKSYRLRLSDNMTFAASVAEFGMILRNSEFKGNATFQSVLELAEACDRTGRDDYRKEFLKLVKIAEESMDN